MTRLNFASGRSVFLTIAALLSSAALGQAHAAPKHPKFSRDDVIVSTRMAQFPKNLHLTVHQKAQLRVAFLDAAHKESKAIHSVRGFYRQRQAVAPIAEELRETEKKILTPEQYRLLLKGRPEFNK